MRYINKFSLLGVIAFCSLVSFAQENSERSDELSIIRSKKQIALADLETQIKAIPYAAIRVYARYQLAEWLWKGGKDDLGRAEDIATTAIEDHFKNRNEIPPGVSSKFRLFQLLDLHAKETSKRLKEKYKESGNGPIDSLLDKNDGGKSAVDSAVNLFSKSNEEFPDVAYLLLRLGEQNSPELHRLLAAIITSDQMGRTSIPIHMIELLTGFFIRPDVPSDLGLQFVRLVVSRSRNVAALSTLDQMAYYRVFQRLSPTISTRYPEIVAETGTVQALLGARTDQSTREANERYARINNSSDKLAAAVSEAERTDSNSEKYGLYRYAAGLALDQKKFIYAVDLMVKASEVEQKPGASSGEFRLGIHDEFYRSVASKALKEDHSAGAEYAIRKMNAPLSKAESFASLSKYYIAKNEIESGRMAHDEAIRILSSIESTSESVVALINMIPTGQKLDGARVDELTKLTAKKINSIPSLNVEDRPDTKNYRDYVFMLMRINRDLAPVLTQLARDNRTIAADLALRIEKKEIRVIADHVLSADSIEKLPKPSF